MINVLKLKCPTCGADLEIEDNREVCFCQYCGTKILVSDDNRKTININKNVTYTNIDEAAKLRAENEQLRLKNRISKEDRIKKVSLYAIVIGVIMTILLFILIQIPFIPQSIKTPIGLFLFFGLSLIFGGIAMFLSEYLK